MTNEAKPEYTGEVEDWVVQDIVPRRVAIDQYRWITKHGYASSWGMTLLSPKDRQELSHGHIDEYGSRLEVRCKRMEFPIDGYKVSVDKDGKEKYEPLGRKCDVAERPDDWVTQDVVPRRKHVDQYFWASPDELKNADTHQGVWGWEDWSSSLSNHKHGFVNGNRNTLQVRCKRKDHPVLGKAESRMVSQDELNAAPKTRAWTYGKPAQTGHFLISHKDPAVFPQEITTATLDDSRLGFAYAVWFVYLGQTFDFVDPVVPKARYTLLIDPRTPYAQWFRDPAKIQTKLDQGWTIAKEQEFEVPEWDR